MPGLRRSGREKKSVVKFAPSEFDPARDLNDAQDGSDLENDVQEPDDDAGDDFEAAKPKRKATGSRRKRATSDDDEDSDSAPKAKRGRARKARGDIFGEENAIEHDNDLFEAVRNAETALELTIDEWITSYTDAEAATQSAEDIETSKGPALANLINFVLRCCGCNASLDQHEAVDINNYTSKQKDILQEFQRSATKDYPLIAKTKVPKRFRKSLHEFFDRLIQHAHTSEVIYDGLFFTAMHAWLGTATSSKLRPFRHTATVIALDMITSIARVAAEVAKDFASANRQLDAEVKKGRADKARLTTFQENVDDAHKKKEVLESHMEELFKGVFLHRFRDSEHTIRSDCVRALGEWMTIYPDFYLASDYLRYIGWILTDLSKEPRLEAIKALEVLYSNPDFLGSLQIFTARFKARFIELAVSEPDIAVRRSAIVVLLAIDQHGLLEEEEQTQLARLIFHMESRVRLAIAPYFIQLLEEQVEEAATEAEVDKDDQDTRQRLWFKHLAKAFVEYGSPAADNEHAQATLDDGALTLRHLIPYAEIHDQASDRVLHAVEALRSHSDNFKEWQALADYLLLDHTDARPNATGKGKARSDDVLTDLVRLEADQESTLLRILVAAIAKRKVDLDFTNTARRKAGENADADEEVTRGLIKVLPLLLEKYKETPEALQSLLQLVQAMNLDLYLDMRIVTTYEELWDLIATLFVQQTNAATIDSCLQAIKHLVACSILSETNESKLEHVLKASADGLREVAKDIDVENAALSEAHVVELAAGMTRTAALLQNMECSASMEDNGGLRYTSVWSICDGIAERGRLGFGQEESMVQQAITALTCHFMWKLKALTEDTTNIQLASAFVELREKNVDRCTELALGPDTQATAFIKREAFIKLIHYYLLCFNIQKRLNFVAPADRPDLDLDLVCQDELQYRLSGFMEAEIEQFMTEFVTAEEVDTAEDEDSDTSQPARKKTKKRSAEHDKVLKIVSTANTADQYRLQAITATFVKAITLGIISIKLASTLLTHLGRITAMYDECAKVSLGAISQEALYTKESESIESAVQAVVDTLCGSLDLYVDHQIDEATFVATARALTSAIRVHGPRLKIEARLADENLTSLHQTVINKVLKQVSNFEETDRRQKSERALLVFKGLALMLVNLTPSEADAIHKVLDAALEANGLNDDGDMWSHQHAYVRKLVNASSKSNGKRPAKRAKKMHEASEHTDDEDETEAPKQASKKVAKPSQQPTRTRQPRGAEKVVNYADIENENQDVETDMPPPPPRPRKQTAPVPHKSPIRGTLHLNGTSTKAKKRAREVTPDADENQDNVDRPRSPTAEVDEDALEHNLTHQSADRPRPPDSQTSQLSVSHYKRRRIG